MDMPLLRSFMPHHSQVGLTEKFRSGIAGGSAILLLALGLILLGSALRGSKNHG